MGAARVGVLGQGVHCASCLSPATLALHTLQQAGRQTLMHPPLLCSATGGMRQSGCWVELPAATRPGGCQATKPLCTSLCCVVPGAGGVQLSRTPSILDVLWPPPGGHRLLHAAPAATASIPAASLTHQAQQQVGRLVGWHDTEQHACQRHHKDRRLSHKWPTNQGVSEGCLKC